MDQNHYESFQKMVGNNVRRIRNERGLTMEDVANASGIEYRQLSRIELGNVNTTIISLLRISEVLRVDVYLFFISDSEIK